MEHEIVLENSNSDAVCTLLNIITYLKVVRLRQIYQRNLELKIRRANDGGLNAVLWL